MNGESSCSFPGKTVNYVALTETALDPALSIYLPSAPQMFDIYFETAGSFPGSSSRRMLEEAHRLILSGPDCTHLPAVSC
jgi:hypothetical protein